MTPTPAIKLTAFGLGIFFFLCITINNKPIFSHIYGIISPATTATQTGIENLVAFGYRSAERFSKKLFSNSTPKLKDTIRSSAAAPLRRSTAPQETIEKEDREELDELIKSHH